MSMSDQIGESLAAYVGEKVGVPAVFVSAQALKAESEREECITRLMSLKAGYTLEEVRNLGVVALQFLCDQTTMGRVGVTVAEAQWFEAKVLETAKHDPRTLDEIACEWLTRLRL